MFSQTFFLPQAPEQMGQQSWATYKLHMGNDPLNLIDIVPICFSTIYSFLILLIRYRRMSQRNEKDSPLTGLLQKKISKTKSCIDFFKKKMIPSICLFCKNIP